MMKNSKAKIILILFMIIIGVTITASVYAKHYNQKEENLRDIKQYEEIKQPSICEIEDGYIYYVSLKDWKIYSIEANSGLKEQIYSDKVSEEGILINSNYIYFKNKNDNKLYRIKKDKTELERVSDYELGRQYEGFLSVNDEIIYYNNEGQPHRVGNDIYNNSDKEFYKRIYISSKYSNGFLYFIDNDCLKSYRIISGEEKKLTDACVYRTIYTDDKFIYYINNSDYYIYKVSTDGKEKSILVRDKVLFSGADFDFYNVEIKDNYIYYISYELPEEPLLCRFSLVCNKKEIIKQNVIDFRMTEKGLFYISNMDEKKLCFMDFDTLSTDNLDSSSIVYLAGVKNGSLIYSVQSDDYNSAYGQLYVIDSVGRKIELE